MSNSSPPTTTTTTTTPPTPPSSYDNVSYLLPYLDPHMILPLLEFLQEKQLYNETDLLQARVDLAGQKTKMVDFWAAEYKLLHNSDPTDLEQRRQRVYDELNAIQEGCGKLLTVLNDESDIAAELRASGNFTFDYLHTNYQVTAENVDNLYAFAKLNFDCGRYSDSADYLYYYRLLAGARGT
jgi:translation initiation factor 3 subunit E